MDVSLVQWRVHPNELFFLGIFQTVEDERSILLFQVLIDVETYEYFSVHSKGSEGVLVLVQHYRDIPLMRKESFVLGPGSGKKERE